MKKLFLYSSIVLILLLNIISLKLDAQLLSKISDYLNDSKVYCALRDKAEATRYAFDNTVICESSDGKSYTVNNCVSGGIDDTENKYIRDVPCTLVLEENKLKPVMVDIDFKYVMDTYNSQSKSNSLNVNSSDQNNSSSNVDTEKNPKLNTSNSRVLLPTSSISDRKTISENNFLPINSLPPTDSPSSIVTTSITNLIIFILSSLSLLILVISGITTIILLILKNKLWKLFGIIAVVSVAVLIFSIIGFSIFNILLNFQSANSL
jgi:hypothetical protein